MRKRFIAAAVGAALLLGACQNPPVNNVIDAPLGAPEGVTLDQVRQAIMFAGNKRGWQMRQDVPGKIIATHQRSGHMAVIDILYTTTTFSIVYFDSAKVRAANGAKSAKLYAPSIWRQGSSYSHLDEAIFPAGNKNSLMTYAIGDGETIRTPGPVAVAILKSIGW